MRIGSSFTRRLITALIATSAKKESFRLKRWSNSRFALHLAVMEALEARQLLSVTGDPGAPPLPTDPTNLTSVSASISEIELHWNNTDKSAQDIEIDWQNDGEWVPRASRNCLASTPPAGEGGSGEGIGIGG
jgi:hypothetical protein